MVCFAWQMSFDDLGDPDLTCDDPRLSRESNRNKSDLLKIGSNQRGGREVRGSEEGRSRGERQSDKRVQGKGRGEVEMDAIKRPEVTKKSLKHDVIKATDHTTIATEKRTTWRPNKWTRKSARLNKRARI